MYQWAYGNLPARSTDVIKWHRGPPASKMSNQNHGQVCQYVSYLYSTTAFRGYAHGSAGPSGFVNADNLRGFCCSKSYCLLLSKDQIYSPKRRVHIFAHYDLLVTDVDKM